MSEVVFANENLVSTSRAAELSGYSRDYLGQLCRSGALMCKMISDQWYVDTESLRKYVPNMSNTYVHTHEHKHERQQQSDHQHNEKEKKAYSIKIGDVRSGAFKYDGKDYVPTQKAAKLTGYTQDYIGQLARGGEIEARKVGRRWYVAREALLEHKEEKDMMLRAVQSDAAGVAKPKIDKEHGVKVPINTNFDLKYFGDVGRPLIPHNTIAHGSITPEVTIPHDDASRMPQGGRFSAITNHTQQKHQANTHLGYTGRKKVLTPIVQDATPVSTKTIRVARNVKNRGTGTKKVIIFFAALFFGAFGVVFSLIYLNVVGRSFFEPLRPVYNVVKSIEGKYGNLIPGKTLRYSN